MAWLLTVCIHSEGAETATATLVVGKVTFVAKGGAEPEKLDVGTVLEMGTTIKTDENSRAVILTSRQSAIRIGANSIVVLDELLAGKGDKQKAKVRIDLQKGSLGALIKSKEFGEMDFSIKTPHGVAAARGTFYAVAVGEDKSYTQVEEGVVEVTAAGPESDQDSKKDELGKAIPAGDEDE